METGPLIHNGVRIGSGTCLVNGTVVLRALGLLFYSLPYETHLQPILSPNILVASFSLSASARFRVSA
jgi:hypothetical protein